MIIYTDRKIKMVCRAFVGLVFSLIMIFGLFVGVPVKTAQASNNYVDDIYIYKDDYNYWRLHFHVKTTFGLSFSSTGTCSYGEHSAGLMTSFAVGICSDCLGANITPEFHNWVSGYEFTAGQTYDTYLTRAGYYGTGALQGRRTWDLCYCLSTDYNCSYKRDNLFNNQSGLYFNPSGDYTFQLSLFGDTEYYEVKVFPSLFITYPLDNNEIANAFYIQGNYNLSGSSYNKLVAFVGRGVPYYQYSFYQDLLSDTGLVNLRIAGLPAGDNYTIRFYFYGEGLQNYYVADSDIYNINILNDIPPELPQTDEIPPDIFSSLSAQTIYGLYSNYGTSTPLFITISNAIEPLILTIGNNLTFFSSQFSQTNAKDIGEKTGNAVLLVRAYAGNINSFFNDLPISEVLFLYLMTLVVVSSFRIIRILLKLIPFT